MVVNEIIAIALGYLLGSIPSAYIAARTATGKDIRQMGGGNVGGLNTYREVGVLSALVVSVIDIGKGAAAVAIAYWLLDVPQLFVMLTGLAAVVGHMWMVFLKFSGGKGMGTTFGALAILMPVYGYWSPVSPPHYLADNAVRVSYRSGCYSGGTGRYKISANS